MHADRTSWDIESGIDATQTLEIPVFDLDSDRGDVLGPRGSGDADEPGVDPGILGADTHPSVDVDADEDAQVDVVGGAVTVIDGADTGKMWLLGRDATVLGRGEEADLSFADVTVSRQHARLDLRDGQFRLGDLGSHNGTFVDGSRVADPRPLPQACRLRLGKGTLLQFLAVDEAQAAALKMIADSLVLDRVTGTGNRAFLERRLREELSFALRHGTRLGVLLLDVDRFKQVNDCLGHLAGDRLLGRVGRLLKDTVRLEDAVFRYGGDEFCVVVRGIDPAGLRRIGQRIRREVAARLGGAGAFAGITVSIGIAALRHTPADNRQVLMERADAALYLAKDAGRNLVCYEGEMA